MDSGTPPWPPDASGSAIPQVTPGEPPPEKRPAWIPWAAGVGVVVLAVGAFFVAKSIAGGSNTPSAVASTGSGNGTTNTGNGNGGGTFEGRFPGTGGEITAIGGSTLTVKDRRGKSVEVKTTGSTTVMVEKTVGVDAIATGNRIMVTGSTSGSTVAATSIAVVDVQFNGQGGGQGGPQGGPPGAGNFTPPTDATGNITPPTGGNAPNFGTGNGNARRAGNFTVGTVTKVDGGTITIETFDGSTKPVTTTSSTKVTKSVKGAFSDLEVGDNIRTTGDTDSSGNVTATNINEGTGGFGGFRGQAAG